MLDEGDDVEDDDFEDIDESQLWVTAINRGGLTLINGVTYDAFIAIEEETRRVLWAGSKITDKVTRNIASGEDVQFYWSLICADWEEDSSEALLLMVISQYLKIRKFHYTSAKVEAFKMNNKKTTQKSKGLRKELISQPEKTGSKTESS